MTSCACTWEGENEERGMTLVVKTASKVLCPDPLISTAQDVSYYQHKKCTDSSLRVHGGDLHDAITIIQPVLWKWRVLQQCSTTIVQRQRCTTAAGLDRNFSPLLARVLSRVFVPTTPRLSLGLRPQDQVVIDHSSHGYHASIANRWLVHCSLP